MGQNNSCRSSRPLLAHYERWAAQPGLPAQDRRSIESAVALLWSVQKQRGSS
jgi:hypothetical protein